MAASVEDQIAAALVTVFQGVTVAGGYQTEVQAVYRHDEMPSELPVSNAVAFQVDRTIRNDGAFHGLMQKTLVLHVALYSKGWEGHERRMSVFEADVEKALYQDGTLGGLSQDVQVGFSERFLPDPGKEDIAVTLMEVAVQFRHVLTDPYTVYVEP